MKAYFLKYCNYYDREVKPLGSISEYQSYLVGDVVTGIINFTEADGVDTTFILNTYDKVSWIGNPDYVVYTDDDGNILHRWFVMDLDKLRNGQFKVTLHRDVVVDNYDTVINSPCFIEKATVPETNDLIFNSEGNTYNQIKQKEILLQDESESAWIVGYLSRNYDSGTGTISTGSNYDISLSSTPHTSWDYIVYSSSSNALRAYPTNVEITMNIYDQISTFNTTQYKCKFNNFGNKYKESTNGFNGFKLNGTIALDKVYESDYPSWFDMDSITLDLRTLMRYSNYSDVSNLKNYANKRILFSDGVYKCIITTNNYTETKNITSTDGAIYSTDLYSIAKDNIQQVTGQTITSETAPLFVAKVEGQEYTVKLIKVVDENESVTWSITSGRNRLKDNPYDMFAIPLNEITFGVIPGGDSYTQNEELGMMVASDIISQLETGTGTSELYDVQIVPYCPMQKAIQSSNTISTIYLTEHTDYEYIKNSAEEPIGIILFPETSSFTTTIAKNIPVTNAKIQSETEMYRLCSPNYSGIFEFNVAKNGGVRFFEANCTYLPYNPYIQINPNFGRLYGKDFNDNRGLICGGEFSLAIINDQWKTYQLNNKNYEKSFQRNITSQELQNKYAGIRDIAGALSGTVGAGVTGSSIGGPAGAIGMSAVSAAAGVADVYMNKQLRQESLNLQKDQFSYSLQNIQALPYTLSRTTSYTINNKYFPFIEQYTCSDVEREALINKLKYEGMTVMTIGKINDYLQGTPSFIKGNLIKIQGNDYFEDNHMSTTIRDRIAQGVYI